MKNITEVTELNFPAEVEQASHSQLVVADFWAEWCGPCKMLAPVLADLAEANPTVKFVKVNVDTSPALGSRFQIQSIPTLVFLRNGAVVDVSIGLSSKAVLQRKVAAHAQSAAPAHV